MDLRFKIDEVRFLKHSNFKNQKSKIIILKSN